LGYDFWGQTCPSVEIGCNDSCNAVQFPANTWALRGDAHVYGFHSTAGVTDDIQPIPATYNATTVFNIGKAFEGPAATNNNIGVDNPQTPLTVTGPVAGNLAVSPVSNAVAIYGSQPAVYIQQTDLDICNITKGLSNSIFTELNYTWIDRECWVPYLGIGARVEFGSNSPGDNNGGVAVVNNSNNGACCSNNNNDCCGGCGTCTATVWGIWIKGGLSFN